MKALKFIGIAVLIIIIAGGLVAAGYFLYDSNSHNHNNNVPDQTTTSNSNNVTPEKTTKTATCNADELSLAIANTDQPGAGTLALNLVLTNTGTRDCILGGYPGVSLVNDNGNQIGEPAARTTNIAEKTLTLKPQTSVTSTVFYPEEGNFDPGTCTDGATKLRVYPPNDTGYLSIAQTQITGWCPGFQVGPVQANS